VAEADAAAVTDGGADADGGARGLDVASIDPFALWVAFSKWVRAGKVSTAFVKFLARWREPIDVKVDKRLDLSAFGKGPNLFLKTPRPKRPEELDSSLADRMKKDVERQFNLRNLSRFVKTVNRDDPLEYKRQPVVVGKLDVDARGHMKDVYKRIEGITLALGVEHVREELAWRHRMLEVMQWERYFSKEVRENWTGPMWMHDPDRAPPPPKPSPAEAAPAHDGPAPEVSATAAPAEGASGAAPTTGVAPAPDEGAADAALPGSDEAGAGSE